MKRFLKIYLWQLISLLSGFAAMFIVTPYLSSRQNDFGIYSFVISLSLFLSYADFGFLTAGVKFASEAYANDNRQEEQQILGFVIFIMAAVFLLFGLGLSVFAFKPEYILKDLKTADNISLAQNLMIIFISSLPILVAQRGVQLIFNIRLYDYLFQRISSLANLIKIASAFYFFAKGSYNIIGFYVFTQVTNSALVVLACVIAWKKFDYNFISFFKAIKYNSSVYEKTKKLAFSSLYVTISWVVYYELDSLIIGRFVGLKEVAIFNICISIMALARSLYGIIYNPFYAKFNHYLGKSEYEKLNSAFYKILILGLPLSIIPTAALILSMRNFVYVWVGVNYSTSIPIISIMFASYFFTFLSNPASIAMVSTQDLRKMYITSTILPLVYWLGIIITFNKLGLFAFGLFKFISFLISAIIYFQYTYNLLKINWTRFFKHNIMPAIITVIVLMVMAHYFNGFLPLQKGKAQLGVYFGFIFLYGLGAMAIYYMLSSDFKKVVKEIVRAY